MPPSESDLERWRELHAFYVQRLRAQGVENVIVADIPGYGQDLSVLAEKDFADPLADSCNVLFGFHAYGALGDFAAHENAIQKVQVKNYLVMVGEFGVAYPVEAGNAGLPEDNVTGFEAMRVLGPKYGIGVLWWHAVGDNNTSIYALKRDRSGFWTSDNGGNLTPYGQKFWNLSQSVSRARGAFQGDVSSSRCSSAGS